MTAPGFHLQSATSDFNKRADSTFAQLSNQGLSHASASVKPPSHLADATKYVVSQVSFAVYLASRLRLTATTTTTLPICI